MSEQPSGQPKPKQRQQRGYRGRRDRGRLDRDRHRARLLSTTPRGSVDHLHLPLEQAAYVVFDIETTGGNPDRNGITEIFAIRYQNGKPAETFYSMVNPKIPIPPIVRRMTGITNAMVKDAPLIEEVMPSFCEFIGEDILVSHNTIGDMKFLRHFAQKTTGKNLTNYFLCTHLLIEKLVPGAPDKSLKGLSQYFALGNGENHHRAEADAYMTLALFEKLLALLAEQEVPAVIDAIRYQGDFESAARLGWGVPSEALLAVPQKPGTLFLHDHRGRVTFLVSTHNLAHEINRLQRLTELPKQLLKIVLASSNLTFLEAASAFAATLQEIEHLEQHAPRFDPENWHQRVANFMFVVPDADGFRLDVGPLEKGSVFALGPVQGNREAHDFVAATAEVFEKKVHRNGVRLSVEEGHLLLGYLENQGRLVSSLWQKVFGLLPALGTAKREARARKRRLTDVRFPANLKRLMDHTGILATPEGQRWRLYAIQHGRVLADRSVPHLDDAWSDKEWLRKTLRTLQDAQHRRLDPLTPIEANSANRISWWIYFGVRRERGRFVDLQEIKKILST